MSVENNNSDDPKFLKDRVEQLESEVKDLKSKTDPITQIALLITVGPFIFLGFMACLPVMMIWEIYKGVRKETNLKPFPDKFKSL